MAKSHRPLLLCLLVGSTSVAALGAEFAWVPIGATGSHTIVGNEIFLNSDDQIVTLEIRLSKFDVDLDGDPRLSAYQATLDSRGYGTGAGVPLTPLVEGPCAVDADCDPGLCGNITPGICDDPQPEVGAFGIITVCFDSIANPPLVPCVLQSDCAIACIFNPEFPFSSQFSFAVSTGNPDYEYLAAAQVQCIPDNGSSFHGGILKVVVPPGAIGTYTINFLDDLERTGMRDCAGVGIVPIDLVPAKISIICVTDADCNDDNACTTDDCLPAGACTNEPNFNDSQFCCAPTTGNLKPLSDLNSCTRDICNANGTVSHPGEPAGTACGNPTNSQCDKPDSCDGINACLDNLEPNGFACGDPTNTDCNGADTCNGSGTCLNNILQAGSACGDNANTDCTAPDTCNAVGSCLDNHQVDGAVCNDNIFCNVGELCANGQCAGGAPRNCADTLPCTSDSCNELVGQCDNLLDPGNCLITGTCFADAELNPQDDCQECDSAQNTTDWVIRAEGSLCDDGRPCTGTGSPGSAPDSCSLLGVCVGQEDPACIDSCDFAMVVLEGTTPANNSGQGPDDAEASCQPNSNNDVWFLYTATCDGDLSVSTSGSNLLPINDSVLSVYTACPASGGTEIACDDNSGAGFDAAVSFFATNATDYLIRVAGFDVNAGDIALNIATVQGCVIDFVCYANGDLNPLDPCLHCDPSLSTVAWFPTPAGSACGSDVATDCDNADTCNGSGICQTNLEPDGTICTEDGNDCSVDICSLGQCIHPPQVEGTACGDTSDAECDHPDTCNATSQCLPNFEPQGVACGDGATTDCTNPDTCNGQGSCLSNHQANGTVCNDNTFCNVGESCASGQCTGGDPRNCADSLPCTTDSCNELASQCDHPLDPGNCVIDGTCFADGNLNPQDPCLHCDPSLSTVAWSPTIVGSPCGSAEVTDCDNADTCDGFGICETNPNPDGTLCTDDDNDCSFNLCAAGQCDHPPVPVDTPCGDPSDAECDHPDSCNATGQCLPNFEPQGVACGDGSADQCNDPDSCDGNGACDPNFPPFRLCDDGDICTGTDTCSLGLCVGSPIPQAALVESIGPKALGITPQPVDSLAPIALFVTSPDWPCLGKYLGGIPRCSGSARRCESSADCNRCSLSFEPCIVDADCLINGETCVVSGETCDPGVIEPIDINNDGFDDGVRAALLEDPALRAILTPGDWGTSLQRCNKSFAPCVNNFSCDVGICIAPECQGGVCSFLGPCSVGAQDCGLFCSGSLVGCAVNGDCPGGQTCVTSACVVDEVCIPGKVFVTGSEIVPGTQYEVRSECGAFTSDPGVGTPCLWADVNCSGILNVTDIQLMLLGFKLNFKLPFEALNIWPCNPNALLNVSDIQRALFAFKGQTYAQAGCPVPCPQ